MERCQSYLDGVKVNLRNTKLPSLEQTIPALSKQLAKEKFEVKLLKHKQHLEMEGHSSSPRRVKNKPKETDKHQTVEK
jgi:hypothetical protein